MKKHRFHNRNGIFPFLVFSIVTGFLSAVVGTAFKLGAEGVIHLSGAIYGAVRQFPLWIPALVIGAAVLGLLASFVVSAAQSCKGGGIPSSVAAVRGITELNWLPSALVLPFSALLTFFGGLPLGTEGPCVQMGTAIGDGVIQCAGGKKHKAWRRYVMTSGAAAGFSIATASPISAILFSVEELHKKCSPLLLAGVCVSVMTAQSTAEIFALLGIGSVKLFHFPEMSALSIKFFFAPVLVGIVCGICSALFTQCYHKIGRLVRVILQKLSIQLLFPVLFACVAILGFFLPDTLGTGHALVDEVFQAPTSWYLLILVFLIRAVTMMVANTAGTTGGVFLPTLAFGAMVGALSAEGMIALGLMESQHYGLLVILGIAAFLGATSRIPITACVFAMEAMGGIHNGLVIVIATTIAYLVAKLSGVEDFTDAVIEAKEHAFIKGKVPTVIVVPLTVTEDSFILGKHPRDILWPHGCAVVSVKRVSDQDNNEELQLGDIITLRYKTYHPAITAREICALAGEQDESVQHVMVPEDSAEA